MIKRERVGEEIIKNKKGKNLFKRKTIYSERRLPLELGRWSYTLLHPLVFSSSHKRSARSEEGLKFFFFFLFTSLCSLGYLPSEDIFAYVVVGMLDARSITRCGIGMM